VTPPTVTGLSPKLGPVTGGTSVTITGTGFAAATKVSFGATSATHFTINSPFSITATSPSVATASTVDVTVSNAGGASATSGKDKFKYLPSVDAVTPNSGSTLGGTSVTVTGTGFAVGSTATSFAFGVPKATSVECASTTSCTMIAPAGTGTVNVVAKVNKLKSPVNAPADQFTYN